MLQRSVYEWIEKFKNGRTSVRHEGSGACVARCSAKNIFFSEGIKKLVQRWKKCIEKHGDYVEKWCYYKFSIFIEIKFVSVVRIIIDSLTHNVVIRGIQNEIFITQKCFQTDTNTYQSAAYDFTLLKKTVARFVGTGSSFIRDCNGHMADPDGSTV